MISINKEGYLQVGNFNVVTLAEKYDTPLYILDEEIIRNNCKEYKESFNKFYNHEFKIVYAAKANLSKAICRIIQEEGLYLDCASYGEIYVAKSANFSLNKIYFHGNNKSEEELRDAITDMVGKIVVDHEEELALINNICKEKNQKQEILLRITPGVRPKTHKFVQTGQFDTKFGIDIRVADKVINKILGMKYINLVGLHAHIGSQILNLNAFKLTAEIMIDFIANLGRKTAELIRELNLGGGLGINYTEKDKAPSIKDCVKVIATTVIRKCKERKLPLPVLVVEPGRSIIGPAGITLYRIGAIKKNVRKYVVVDGGMTDNIRPALYNAKYTAIIANKAKEKKTEIVTIAGKCCEQGDILINDIKLQKCSIGDYLAVFNTGAYCYSMASNYNKLLMPATVLVNKNKEKLIIKRETYEQLIKNEI